MKKIFVIIAAVGVLYSCGGNTQKGEEEKASVEEFSEIAKNVADKHNAKTSLDYQGTYTGTLPAADAPGMLVSLTLSDSTFVRTTEFVGKKNSKSEEKGKYTWNDKGNTIILDGIKEGPNQYFVGENTLTQLDMEGNKITGDLAEHYVLKK